MIRKKLVFRILGLLLIIEGLFMLLSVPVSYFYGDKDYLYILASSAITLLVGFISWLFTRNTRLNINKKEGYTIVCFVWIIFSFFGALPFYLSGAIPTYTNAFFETISGFTTTGASILNDIESISHGLLFWRSLTQWLGGMGIIVMSLAIFPILGIGGMQLFMAEVPGPTPDKLHPRVKETAKRLWGIYIIFTFSEFILLILGGIDGFDAICHSFSTMATGGYSTKQSSIAFFDSAYIQYVIILFMFLAGTNFTLSYFALHFRFKKIFKNEEFRYYLGFIIGFTIILVLSISYFSGGNFEKTFRDSLFQVVSIITTTGFVTTDYLLWPPFIVILLFLLMFFGGSAGSTGGSIKIVRVILVLKNSFIELKRLLHTNAVIPVRLNGKGVHPTIISNVLAFFVLYLISFVFGVIVMSVVGLDIVSAIGSVAATLGNIGPGIGSVGPIENFDHIPVFGKWFLSFLMLLGRLELFTVLVLFTKSFWKK
ncbi:TrkH family potassium uptake protein [Bacteroidota bacterium]